MCASGSQVCSGNAGSLTAKAAKKPSISSIAVLGGHRRAQQLREVEGVARRSARPWMKYSATMATSISSPLTCVKMKNLMAEYTRRSWPQTAMRKYIGMSIISKKK